MAPVIRVSFQRHAGNNPNGVGLVEIEKRVRKIISQVSPDVAVDSSASMRRRTGVGNQSFDLLVIKNRPPSFDLMMA